MKHHPHPCGRSHLFRLPHGEVIAIDTRTLDHLPIDESLGEPMFDGQAVADVIADAFLVRCGGRRLHLDSEGSIRAHPVRNEAA